MELAQITLNLLTILVFLFPLFFTTLTPEYYDTNKQALLFLILPVLLVLWTFSMAKNKKFVFGINRLNLPVLFFTSAFVLATIFGSVNKIESLTVSTGTAVVIALTLLYFLIANLKVREEQLVYPLIASASILSVLFILQYFGLPAKILPYDFLKDKLFTPAGNLISLVLVTATVIPLAVEEGLSNSKNMIRSLFGWTATVILSLGLLFTLIAIFKEGRVILLPYNAAWAIAVDSLRNLKNAFVGIGPGHFINAFTQSRPLELNNTNLWAVTFTNSSSFLLGLLTEAGLIGFISYLLIGLSVLKIGKKHFSSSLFISFLIIFAGGIILPATILTLFVLFVLLGLLANKTQQGEIAEQGVILPRTFMVFSLALAFAVYWFGYRFYRAENYFLQSIIAASQNKGVDTYNNQIKAIELNPYADRYRIAYSQTNLALASAIAQKQNPSDQDRQNISNLIQQAIREAKIATSLNPNKAGNWENLAIIYRNLINAAEGADQWTIAAYNQAVKLNPLNPALRISLGGVFYSLKNYDAAIQQFTLAVNLKPDWANAHYNLSYAYKEKGDIQQAFNEMQNTLALVDPNSNDFTKASQELEELRKKLPAAPEKSGEKKPETLTKPENQAVELKPKLELPKEEAAPEIPQATPTPEKEEETNQPTLNP